MGHKFGTIIQIGDVLVSEDVVEEFFACDYPRCKGCCCIIGDSGAPLKEEELDPLEKEYGAYAPLMEEAGRRSYRAVRNVPSAGLKGRTASAPSSGLFLREDPVSANRFRASCIPSGSSTCGTGLSVSTFIAGISARMRMPRGAASASASISSSRIPSPRHSGLISTRRSARRPPVWGTDS